MSSVRASVEPWIYSGLGRIIPAMCFPGEPYCGAYPPHSRVGLAPARPPCSSPSRKRWAPYARPSRSSTARPAPSRRSTLRRRSGHAVGASFALLSAARRLSMVRPCLRTRYPTPPPRVSPPIPNGSVSEPSSQAKGSCLRCVLAGGQPGPGHGGPTHPFDLEVLQNGPESRSLGLWPLPLSRRSDIVATKKHGCRPPEIEWPGSRTIS
jgi:hypothetical protein